MAALRRIQSGPRNSAGWQLAGGYLPSGSEAGDPTPQLGWEGYLLRGKSGKPGGKGLAEAPERNVVQALQQWTDGKRAAPENLTARRSHSGGMMGAGKPGPERQRLLCAWPKRDVLKAGGDPDQAASYLCS